MELTLKRIAYRPSYTIGHLYAGHRRVCDTLEPTADTRRTRHPCIPAGRYPLVMTKSPRFGRWLPLLLGVPGRNGIRIHAGNTPRDTQGCILPGENRKVGRVLDSQECLRRIINLYNQAKERGEPVYIAVRDSPHRK